MTFRNPHLLLALPALLLPVLIHWLNRFRYRTVRWAATLFLASATRRSLRRSRIRHYLILAARTLAVGTFILALSRPATGGWFGALFRAPPEAIVAILDRSASMEAKAPGLQGSLRERALMRFAAAVRELDAQSRLIIVESALGIPREVAGAAAFSIPSLTGPTDTAADFPTLFRAAADWLLRAGDASAEIWVASDLQRSNWRPEAPEWKDIAARLAALPSRPCVRLLALAKAAVPNRSLAVQRVVRHLSRRAPSLVVHIRLVQEGSAQGSSSFAGEPTLPVVLTLDGARFLEQVPARPGESLIVRRFDLRGAPAQGGWGRLDLPADGNERDNTAWFVYPGERVLHALVAADDARAGSYCAYAAAPDSARLGVHAEMLSVEQADPRAWTNFALVVWQAPAPNAEGRRALHAFVESGGVVVCLPPGQIHVAGLFDVQWEEVETASEARPFRVDSWEEGEGPLARTENGQSLPVSGLDIQKRQRFTVDGEEGSDFFTLARYADGVPFLLRRVIGRGRVYLCTTLPGIGWSNLDEGTVLVPMVQRMLEEGIERLAQAEQAWCGEWKRREEETWVPLDPAAPQDPHCRAGVYVQGSRRLALNRPLREDSGEFLKPSDIVSLFGSVPVYVTTDVEQRSSREGERDITAFFWALVVAALVLESLLVLKEALPGTRSARCTSQGRAV